MKKKFLLLSKVFSLIIFYTLILIAAVFFTMSFLIKGEEMPAPDLMGKSLLEAYKIASQTGVYLKKITVNYDKNFKPATIINQGPLPGARIKEKSIVTIYVTSGLVEVVVPDLTNYQVKEAEKILEENDLRKQYVSYIEADNMPGDMVISQSLPAGAKVGRGSGIDLLVNRGRRGKSYIMPDVISRRVAKVLIMFEQWGFKVAQITEVFYPDTEPGFIINQHPLPGHKINSKNLISVEVSQ